MVAALTHDDNALVSDVIVCRATTYNDVGSYNITTFTNNDRRDENGEQSHSNS